MHKYIKLVLVALFTVLSAYLISEGAYEWSILTILLAVIALVLYFRNEYILLAFWQIRKQNLEGAKKWMNKITNPQAQLIRKQMGYYHYMLGLSMGQENFKEAEKNMKKALDYGLSFKHDRAMVKLSLAGGEMSRGRKKEAQALLKEAEKLDTNGMMSEQIKMMKEQMKRINVGRNLHNPNMRRKGFR